MILKWLQTHLKCLQIHFEEQKLQNQSFDIQSKKSSWFRESFATSLLMLLLFDCMMNDFQKHFSFEWSNFLFGTYILWVVNCAGLGLINHLWKSHVICNYDEEWWCSVHNYNRVSCFLDGWKFFTQKRGGPRRDWMEFNLKLYFHVEYWFCNLEITAEDSFVSSDDLANLINYLQMQAYQGGTLQIWHNLLIRSDRIIGFLVWFASCTVFQL